MVLLVLTASQAWAIGDKELAAQVAKDTGVDAATVENVIEGLKTAIAANLRSGEEVRFSKFGRFHKERRDAREGRNPGTGAAVQVPARDYLRFKPFDTGHERLR